MCRSKAMCLCGFELFLKVKPGLFKNLVKDLATILADSAELSLDSYQVCIGILQYFDGTE